MTDLSQTTQSDADAADAVHNKIVAGLNAGLSLQAAIRAAIDAGHDETLAHNIGRSLKADIIASKKRTAMGGIRNGALWMVFAIVVMVLRVFVPIPFAGLVALIVFIAGIVQILMGVVAHNTAESKVR